MKKMIVITTVFLLFVVTVILTYIFSPVSFKLTLMGYQDNEAYGFTAYDRQYHIALNDNTVDYISVDQIVVATDEYDYIDLQFFKDNDSNVYFVIYNDTETVEGFYNLTDVIGYADHDILGHDISAEVMSIIQAQYIIITETFSWDFIPRTQR